MKRMKLMYALSAMALALAACTPPQPTPAPTLTAAPKPPATAPATVPATAVPSPTAPPTQPPANTPTPRPSPTARPLANPIVIDIAPGIGEAWPADKPVTLTFDQPMDRASVESALLVSDGARAVTGKLTWTNDRMVAFAPSDGWKRGARYAVEVNDTAKSARGLPLNKPQSFEFGTLGSFKVAQTLPADKAFDVGADAAITVLFNRPVVPLTDVGAQAGLPNPLALTPAVEGKGEWLNTSTFVFRPAAPLAAGTTYTARVAETLKDTLGAGLDAAHAWSFVVAAPTVRFVTPGNAARDVDLRQPISVTFSQKMDRASAEAAFKLTPSVKGSFRWTDEVLETGKSFEPPVPLSAEQRQEQAQMTARLGEVMTFVPEEAYQRATNHALEISAGAKAKAGDGRTGSAQKFTFRTIEAFGVASTQPRAGAQAHEPESRQFSIQFASPVVPESVMPNIRFEPAVSLTNVFTYAEPGGRQFYINNVPLKASTRYRVTLGKDIRDPYGQTLGRDVVVDFTTAALRPAVVLGSGAEVGTLNAGSPARVQVAHRNVTRLDFELVRLSLEEFYNLTGSQRSWQLRREFKPRPDQIVRAWPETLTARPNEAAASAIRLDPTGAALAPGVYLLTMNAPEIARLNIGFEPIRQVLVSSNLQVTLKLADRQALAWVTSLNSGQPVANAPVSFIDRSLKAVAGATTGADGVAPSLSLPVSTPMYEAFYAVVGRPGDASFGVGFNRWSDGIEPYQFGLSADYPDEFNPQRYRVYLYTDRPIYRPGQTVNFKGAIRTERDARFSLPVNITRVPIAVTSDRGARVVSTTVQVTANGTFHGSFALDVDAGTGYYSIRTTLPPNCKEGVDPSRSIDPVCRGFDTNFQVAAYRKPEFEVGARPAKLDYAQGETASVAITASYFFGGNAQNARVEWIALSRPYFFDRYADRTDPFFGRYSFSDDDELYSIWPPSPRIDEQIGRGEGATDVGGGFAINLPIDLGRVKTSRLIAIEGSVRDANDQSVAVQAEFVAHKAGFYFGVAPEEYVLAAGRPFTMHVLGADIQGKPLAGRDGVATLFKREWTLSKVDGRFGGIETIYVPNDTKIAEAPVKTGPDGKAVVVFSAADGGEYRVVVTGGDARAAVSAWLYEPGDYLPWRAEENNRIALRADRDAYKVGETARVLVPSPFSGTVNALLTIERGSILQHKLVQLTSNGDVVDIPITQDMAPNAYVSLVIAKGVDAANRAPAFRVGYTDFRVDPSAFELKVEVTPDRAGYQPRETVTYDIRVTDASRAPVQTELSLSLVDKAVLALAEPNSESPMTFFYAPRGLGVRTSHSLAVRADVADTTKLEAPGGLGGGGGGFAPDQFVREQFKDTAYWSAVIETDAAGRAQVKVQLPDNLTTWVLDARAISRDTKVGSATNEIVTSKPLLVRPVTPRFFTAGDEVTIGAVVNNNTASEVEAEVSLSGTGVSLKTPAASKVKVPARGSTRVNWTVTAGDAPLADLTFSANAGGTLQDTAKPELATAQVGGVTGIPILRYLAPETVGTAGDVSEPGKKTELIMLPPRLDAGKSELTARVDTSLAQINLGAAHLLRMRNDKDTLSIAVRVLIDAAIGGESDAINTNAQRLFENQREDGGWGWFKDAQQSSPIVSAYAYWAMVHSTKTLGRSAFNPEEPLNRARTYLQGQLGDPNTLLNRRAADEAGFILYALVQGDTRAEPAADQLYRNRDKLSSSGKALLALSLNVLKPGDERAKGLLADVYGAASLSATGAMWQDRPGTYAFFGSKTRSTGMVLSALARLDAKNALLPNTVRWLVGARSGSFWESPQDTLWAVLGLDGYADATGERNADYDWRASLNDGKLMDGGAASAEISRTVTVAGGALLREQANVLTFERGVGQGRLYYTAHMKSYLPAEQAKALDRGIAVTRRYEDAACEPAPGTVCAAIAAAQLGKDVRVRLTVVAPNDLHFVRITDPFAAGVEPIDSTLRVNRGLPLFGRAYPIGWWWFTHTDVQDDHTTIYADFLPAGTHEFVYVVRPTIAGAFKVMPASASQVDFPEMFGRSDGGVFEVRP